MKALQSYIFRAISAIVVGALLVKYREETVTWLTILIGVIFFVSGVISCIAYISARRTANGTEIFDAQGQRITPSMPSFPLVGIGSIILGGVLALSPDTFTSGLMYVLAIILILGALGQFFSFLLLGFSNIGLRLFKTLAALVYFYGVYKFNQTVNHQAPAYDKERSSGYKGWFYKGNKAGNKCYDGHYPPE